jgi:hypothetical protein
MSVVRIGATKKYSDNWENIFSGGRSAAPKKSASKPATKSPKKSAKPAAKKAVKKTPASKKRKSK